MNPLKSTALLLCLFSWSSAFADDPVFLVAVKEDDSPITKSADWYVAIGEVYQFVRMTTLDIHGVPVETGQQFVVAKMGDVEVTSAASNFRRVPDSDLAQAAMKYNDEVTRNQQEAAQASLKQQLQDTEDQVRQAQSRRDWDAAQAGANSIYGNH